MLVKFRIDEIKKFEKGEWVSVISGHAYFEITTKLKDIEFKKETEERHGIMVRRRLPENPEE